MAKNRAAKIDRHEWRRPRYSRAHAEVMLCLLDSFCAIEERTATLVTDDKAIRAIREARGDYGSFAVRHMMINLAKPVEDLWSSMPEDAYQRTVTFDWEFCDEVLLYIVDWESLDGNSNLKLVANAREVLIARQALHQRFGENGRDSAKAQAA